MRNFSINVGTENIEILTHYFEKSVAKGALFYFIPFDDNGNSNLENSMILPLNRSNNRTFISLPTGLYSVLVYDIEGNGTLQNGTNYPARRQDNLAINNGNEGTKWEGFCMQA